MLVYLELEQDQNLSHDDRLQLHTIVRSRLQTIEKSLRSEQARKIQPEMSKAQKGANAGSATIADRAPSGLARLAQQVAAPVLAQQAALPQAQILPHRHRR